jgi:flagellin
MPLGILNNIPSLAAENQLTLTNTALQTTLQQLASGSRINSGADDAAGLAIANGLQANVTALTQSVSNANNGVGELQLADGALAQVTTMLNRAVTLATEAATGTVSNTQRTALQAEYSKILDEINRVGSSTTYNGQQVFQSGSMPNPNAQVSPNSGAANALSLYSPLTVGSKTTLTSGGASISYTAPVGQKDVNTQIFSGGASYLATDKLNQAAKTLTITRVVNGVTETASYATGVTTNATTQDLINAINAGAAGAVNGVTTSSTAGTDAVALTGLHASLVQGHLQITDTGGSGGMVIAGWDITKTDTTAANPTAPTVQDLVNFINNDTTVGAKAAVVGGQLQITDPQNRNNLTVTTNDAALGGQGGAVTNFSTPNTTGIATPNLNQLVSTQTYLNAGAPDPNAALGATLGQIFSFTAGGKTFSYTATGTDRVADLLNAINTPGTGTNQDPAGLSAYLNSAGKLVVVDAGNNGNLAVGSTNTETILGSLTNPPSTSVASSTNIFLSDSTVVGSSQIAVSIGALNTTAITNGSGGNAVNLGQANADLTTATNAQQTLTLINSAIANIASVRGTLGASVNRLTAASNVINSQVQNLTAAQNTITAADIPSAVANMTKYSILEQTGISALAQANQQQQIVLKLLQ